MTRPANLDVFSFLGLEKDWAQYPHPLSLLSCFPAPLLSGLPALLLTYSTGHLLPCSCSCSPAPLLPSISPSSILYLLSSLSISICIYVIYIYIKGWVGITVTNEQMLSQPFIRSTLKDRIIHPEKSDPKFDSSGDSKVGGTSRFRWTSFKKKALTAGQRSASE
jgi:hypothetical protein|uniref:Uncharacterized protein n=1 Tax=Picea glauca TaxID=3330 RepID=A0A101LWP4_PICGL|nr:hypothetical protein ABT39_MTgene1405 [Picea glauca]QHR92387.1 hypothetical protein Q903MT_gene6430 [Picea sitchensis]